MAEGIGHEAFAPHVGRAFVVAVDDAAVPLELVQVTPIGTAPGSGTRAPFSLLFVGPAAPALPQRTYAVRHPELGAMEIFLVPVGPDAGREPRGMRYEAVFN
jgi:hypothetical protein